MERRARYSFVWIAGLLAAVALGACAGQQIAKGLEPKEIALAGGETMAGEVTFMHATHAYAREDGGHGIACARCHHEAGDGEAARACRKCHRREEGKAPRMEEAAHKVCLGCHQERAIAEPATGAPLSCPDCHVLEEGK
jgi:predicted CXXCH cytochrome family protein